MYKTKLLLGQLRVLKKLTAQNHSLPILEGVWFDGGKIMSSDLEWNVRMATEYKGLGFVVNLKQLEDCLKAIKTEAFEIHLLKDKVAIGAVGKKREFKLPFDPVDEFPRLPECNKDVGHLRDEDVENIVRLKQFTAKDELRPVMSCVYLEKDQMIATDAHRLCWLPMKGEVTENIMIPREKIELLKEVMNCDVFSNEGYDTMEGGTIRFQGATCEVFVRTVSGKYPDYKAVLPKETPITCKISRKEVLETLGCAKECANKSNYQAVFELSKKAMEVSSQDLDRSLEFKETIEAETEMPEDKFIVGFDLSLLIGILKDIDETYVTLMFQDDRGKDGKEGQKGQTRAAMVNKNHLIMPVMLNG